MLLLWEGWAIPTHRFGAAQSPASPPPSRLPCEASPPSGCAGTRNSPHASSRTSLAKTPSTARLKIAGGGEGQRGGTSEARGAERGTSQGRCHDAPCTPSTPCTAGSTARHSPLHRSQTPAEREREGEGGERGPSDASACDAVRTILVHTESFDVWKKKIAPPHSSSEVHKGSYSLR